MAVLHALDERFSHASLQRDGWFKKTSYFGAQSDRGARSHPGARNTSWVSDGLVFQKGSLTKQAPDGITEKIYGSEKYIFTWP